MEEYHALGHAPKLFVAGEAPCPVSGRVYAASDMRSLVDSSLDFWLTTGRFNDAFEAGLAARLDAQFAMTVNSGSSANLCAFSALTSPKLKDRALRPGDEVITAATGFPTTVNPMLGAGVVLTGGTSLLEGMLDAAEKLLNLPARRGVPGGVGGLRDIVSNPIYSTGVGLLLHARQHAEAQELAGIGSGGPIKGALSRLVGKLTDIFLT